MNKVEHELKRKKERKMGKRIGLLSKEWQLRKETIKRRVEISEMNAKEASRERKEAIKGIQQ